MIDHHPPSQRNSPCDSLSPLDNIPPFNNKMEADLAMFGDVIGFIREEKLLEAPIQQTQRTTCPEPTPPPVCTATSPSAVEAETACSPRSPLITRTHRPSNLTLVRTNGLTTISTPDLRRRICDARTVPSATTIQVPRPKPDNVPPTPGTPSPLFVMGNNASSLTGIPPDDGASVRSFVNRVPAPVRMLRKSSANLLFNGRRPDSKSLLRSRLTAATVISVQQQPSLTSLGALPEEIDVDPPMESDQVPEEVQDVAPSHSASTETIVVDTTLRDLTAVSTLPEAKTTNHIQIQDENRNPRKQSKSESDLRRAALIHRNSALSPSIPAPSPIPEDSPHKYGLKDRMDTPDLPEPPKVNVVQAPRRSSGLEIFHEAKSLQSASSFLNNLSTSRRRAESLQRSSESQLTTHCRTRHNTTTRTHTISDHRSSRPISAPRTSTDRHRGHSFKTSGFAYARALAPAQLKCYRNHMRLIPSSNKRCPVECAVCHIDDDREHFSCSWCALRMCRFCRKAFAEDGMVGLRERIRQAEMSGSSGDEEDEGGRGVNGRA